MRYVTLALHPGSGASLHPLGDELAAEPAITREAIHRVELLDEDTAVLLGEARGDQARYEELMADSEYVRQFTVSGADGWWYAYVQFVPLEVSREMLAYRRQSDLVMEMPIRVREDGAHVFTLVGDESAFAETVPTDTDLYDVEVLETGERAPEVDDLFGSLTARQREILDAAVELGYYETPRQATHADIADRVDAGPSTVGEHLRKIESHVFARFR